MFPRFRRLLSIVTVAALGVASLGVVPASAANPSWDITIIPVPEKVGADHDAGFDVTISNDGPSQINDLSVTVTATDTADALPTYLSDLEYLLNGSVFATTTCTPDVPQTCQLGTLAAGVSVFFTIAYAVPDDERGTFDLEVAIKAGTGDTSADQPKGKDKGQSRGDAYQETGSAVIGSGDFDGGFVVDGDSYQTNASLGPRNIQSTALQDTAELIGVMIEDGISTLDECDSATDDDVCAQLFGEWSRIHVDGGTEFVTPFKVTIIVRGSAVPGGATEDSIFLVHVLDDGSIEVIGDDPGETCSFVGTDTVPNNPDCLTVTKIGGNWKLEGWFLENGALRGGF